MWDRAGEQHRGRSGAELSLDLTPELRKKDSTSITARRMELDMLTCRWRKEKAKRKINGKESHQTHIRNVLKLANISGELWGCYPHHSKWDPLLRTWGSWRPSPAFLILWDSGPWWVISHHLSRGDTRTWLWFWGSMANSWDRRTLGYLLATDTNLPAGLCKGQPWELLSQKTSSGILKFSFYSSVIKGKAWLFPCLSQGCCVISNHLHSNQ